MNFWHHKARGPERNAYFSEQEFCALRAAAIARFRKHSDCEPLKYPGAETLPVYLIPLAYPLPLEALPPIEHLHRGMLEDNVLHGYLRPDVEYEHRQGHLWVAVVEEDKYLPIGQTIFLAEITRPAEIIPVQTEPLLPGGLHLKLEPAFETRKSPAGHWIDEALISKWWLFHTWIKPAYRKHRIFKCSIEFFEAWHPGFVLREREPHLLAALKGHPEHLPQERAISWA